ncbi:hypothetical protein DPMN_121025 [Dreissena polymorpha]|uniref:Uncharacterized protein n=1 Tax=Dreissena polymorpha TaxID=45954 RepID=A0A9D4JP52_DREPO|nr:hypothetical protein DPMN_121025 [Dreissena polymorpha]
MRLLELELDGGEYQVMVTANVCARQRSCVRLVDAGLEPLRRQYENDLVVYLPVWNMPGRCSGRFVWVQRVGKGELVASGELKQSQTYVVGLF